jgi:serine/threonine-protein kinase RsbW/stage II sporulation protein AB (anti-sigma F factor)
MFVEPGRLSVSICDDGSGMAPRPDSPGYGVGLPLIAQLVDELQVRSEQGTCVLMGFAMPRQRAADPAR